MATRQAEKEARRAEREAREREQAAREQRSKRLRLALAAAAGLAVVALAAVFALGSSGGDGPKGSGGGSAASIPAVKTRDLAEATRLAGGKINRYDYKAGQNDHTQSPGEQVTYPMNPPTNGRHYAIPAQDGDYVGRQSPTKEATVHSLEHGRIVIQYRPGLPAAQVAQLEALFNEDPERVLIMQNQTGMPHDVAATAWAQSLTIPKFSPAVFDAIRAFIAARRDQGPEKILQPE